MKTFLRQSRKNAVTTDASPHARPGSESIANGDATTKYYRLSPADVAMHFAVDADAGLTEKEALVRLDTFGANRLLEKPPLSPWFLFITQFRSALILVLIGAAVLSAAIGNGRDALVISVVVLLNTMIGFYQEYRVEWSLAALKKMLPARAYVRREYDKKLICADQLVPGDIVLLEAGGKIPADGRLVIAANFDVDESALTGESLTVNKQTNALSESKLLPADRLNMVYMNSLVTRGRGEMMVTTTGMQTEIGRLSQQLADAPDSLSPLQVQVDQLGKRLGTLAVALVGFLFFLELLRGEPLIEVITQSIALAVAAIPEGLPLVVTITLAMGMQRMAHHRAIVKRLASVETLGCTTVICSDKTGTLTMNQMTVSAFFFRGARFSVSGVGYLPQGTICSDSTSHADLGPLLVPLVACNDSCVDDGQAVGDPMEAALLVLAAKGGIDSGATLAKLPRIAELPFDSAHKFMATFHREGNIVRVFVKGAPDVLLDCCSRVLASSTDEQLDDDKREHIVDEYKRLAASGLRGLLIGSRDIPIDQFDPKCDLLSNIVDLTFLGLVGLMDPPRPEAKQSIAQCQHAGISVKMITGDYRDTGIAIAQNLGLEGGVLTGADLDQMSARQLADRIESIDVIARVSPAHKVRIIRALKAKGHVVAMTGDGVNDAPALKNADIGVAMGIAGTAVAKEAASIVLTDDNFASIGSAVRGGRALYDNILKFIRFQLSTTVGALLTVFFAPLAGLPEPFNPIQILWVAMIMDGPPAVSLALDAARPGIMDEPPRPRGVSLIPQNRLLNIIAYGTTMMVGTLVVLYYGVQSGNEARASTLAFTTFVLFQFFNIFNARVENGTSLNRQLFSNRMLWLSLLGVVALQIVAVEWRPAQAIFSTTGLSASDWLTAVAVASSILVLEEGRKLVGRLRASWIASQRGS